MESAVKKLVVDEHVLKENAVKKNAENEHAATEHIMKETEISSNKSGFNFVLSFDKHPCMILCYENNMSVPNNFFISYVNMKEARAYMISDIIRTIYN